MKDYSNFCRPEEEMDEISRKMRAGEKSIDYAQRFKEQAEHAKPIKPEEEMDASATAIRLQSEQGLDVDEAKRIARRVHGICTPENG